MPNYIGKRAMVRSKKLILLISGLILSGVFLVTIAQYIWQPKASPGEISPQSRSLTFKGLRLHPAQWYQPAP